MENTKNDIRSIIEEHINDKELEELLRQKYDNNKEQFELVEKLRERILNNNSKDGNDVPSKGIHISSDVLHRFLRAREWNIDKAYEQLIKALQWRIDNNVDSILREKQLCTFYNLTTHAFFGYSKKGEPIFWGQSGRTNVTKVLESVSEEKVIRRHIWSVEKQILRMKRQSKLKGSFIDTQIMVLDLLGLSFSMDTRGSTLFRETIQIDQNYYPEHLGHLFIINAPWIFKGIWALISPWIDHKTSQKIHILGADYLNTLLIYIDPDQIPKEYGGTGDIEVGKWDDDELKFLGGGEIIYDEENKT